MNAALAAGEDINQANEDGKTALMMAAALGANRPVTPCSKRAPSQPQDKEGEPRSTCARWAEPEKPKKKRGFGAFMDQAKKGRRQSVVASRLRRSVRAVPARRGTPAKSRTGDDAGKQRSRQPSDAGATFGLGSQGAWSGVLGSALLNVSKSNSDVASFSVRWTVFCSRELRRECRLLLVNPAVNGNGRKDQARMLQAMTNLGEGATAEESAAWAMFLQAAQSEDQETLQTLVSDPNIVPLLRRQPKVYGRRRNRSPGGMVARHHQSLLAHRADKTLTDKDGKTALARAQSAKLEAVAQLLEQRVRPIKSLTG
jgi:hypothetical protein